MKIILVDRLNYPFGGTQKYVLSLAKLLKKNKHDVWIYTGKKLIDNFDSKKISFESPSWTFLEKIQSIYSPAIFFKSLKIFKKIKPDIVHLNNINYQITPSIIHSAKLCHIPIIMTLHDYKPICGRSTLTDINNNPCLSCRQNNFSAILKKSCRPNKSPNILGTLFLFSEQTIHSQILKIYKKINYFIGPSKYLSETYKQMGFNYPIKIIPNFVESKNKKNIGLPNSKKIKMIYFGRISKEKGISTLCTAIKNLDIDLTIVGQGSLVPEIKKIMHVQKNIKLFKFMEEKKLFSLIQKHHFSVLPSEWPENSSLSAIESLSLDRPVLASNIGGNPEIIINNFNGWLFEPKNIEDLRQTIQKIISLGNKDLFKISQNALNSFNQKYSSKIYLDKIINLYEKTQK